LAVGLAALMLSAPAASAIPAGAISGTVTGPDAQPLASGANLWIVIYSDAGQDVNEVSVASDGTYEVSGLTPGQYRVGISDSAEIYGNEFYENQTTLANATPIEVVSGPSAQEVNIELNLGGQITGKVAASLDGSLDHEANVGVLVYDESGRAIRSAAVGSDGSYSVGGLGAGDYRLKFTDSADDPIYATQFYSNKLTLGGATPVHVAAGNQTMVVDTHLTTASGIRGRVSGEDGVPLDPSAQVYADLWTSDAVGTPEVVATTPIEEDGTYEFTGVAAASYQIGFRDDADLYGSAFYGGGSSASQAAGVDVADGLEIQNIDANLVRGGAISGTVSGPEGVALIQPSAVEVTAYDSRGSAVGSASVSEGGEYRLAGLPTGEYRLEFRDGFSTYQSEFYSGKHSLDTATPISVATGSTTAEIDESLSALGSIVGTVKAVGGNVLNTTGTVAVRAYDQTATMVAAVDVQPDGGFYFTELPVGQYRLQFVDDSGTYQPEFYANQQTLAAATPVTVSAGEPLTGLAVELNEPTTPIPAPPGPEGPPAPPSSGPIPTPARSQALLKAPTSLKRKKSRALARTTGAGLAATWSSATPKVCKIKAGKVVAGTKKGTCRLTVTAAGDARWLPLRQTFKLKVK